MTPTPENAKLLAARATLTKVQLLLSAPLSANRANQVLIAGFNELDRILNGALPAPPLTASPE